MKIIVRKLSNHFDIIYLLGCTTCLVLLLIELPQIKPLERSSYQILIMVISSTLIYLGFITNMFISMKYLKDERVNQLSDKTGDIAFTVTLLFLIIFTTNSSKINWELPMSEIIQLIPLIMCYIYMVSNSIMKRLF